MHVDVWQGSEYALCSEYAKALSMLGVLNTPGLWIYQLSEYVRVAQDSEYA